MSRTAPIALIGSFAAAMFVLAGSYGESGAQEAEEAMDPTGLVATLPDGPRDHWVWLSDRVFRHSQLFDGDTGRALGTIDVAWALGGRLPHSAPERSEIYMVETVYARGHRGARTDLVTVYDSKTLAVKRRPGTNPCRANSRVIVSSRM